MVEAQHLGRGALKIEARRRVGILSTATNPLLPHLLDRLDDVDEVEPVLVLDAAGFGERDRAIFADRTAGVFEQRDDPLAGRFTIDVPSHNAPELPGLLRDAGVDLLANGGTPRIVKSAVLDAVVGVVNAHPGLLPKYRGATCTEWALYNGDPVGVTAHFMDAGIDTGPIILSRTLELAEGWDYVDVRVAVYRLSHQVMAAALRRVVVEGLTPQSLPPQPAGDPPQRPMPDELLDVVKGRLARRP